MARKLKKLKQTRKRAATAAGSALAQTPRKQKRS